MMPKQKLTLQHESSSDQVQSFKGLKDISTIGFVTDKEKQSVQDLVTLF